MEPDTPEITPCEAFKDDLAQLALGTLAGRERADILDHLEECPDCAVELEGFSSAADTLLLLAPEATPPVGFAQRVVASMADGRERPRSFSQRIMAVAAVGLIALGVGVGVIVTHSPPHDPSFAAVTLTSSSGAKGDVIVSRGPDTWMFMTLDDVDASGQFSCSVTLQNGRRETVGHFAVRSGYGAWAVWLPMPASDVKSVAIVDSSGVTLASAQIHV